MAAPTRNQTQIDGALYELCARGVKDQYFIKDDKEAAHPFQWTYDRWPAQLPEFRWTQPLNEPRFGQRCEFEFNFPADVLMEATLLITLPSWLPPEMVPYNGVSDTFVQKGAEKVYYGYTNGVGYFLLEKIELYQDKILLQEISGDSLYATQLTRSNWNQGFLAQKIAGIHDGSALSIQRSATPGTLEVPLPMIGCCAPGDRGLPLCGLRNQTFRLRLTLRPLERLVESTDDTEYDPAPFGKIFTQDNALPVPDYSGPALVRSQIGQPQIVLRTKQLYLLNEARDEIAQQTVEVPYLRYFDNHFNINQLDYAPIDRGGVANAIRFLDANYTVERIVIYFRNTKEIQRNRLWNMENAKATTGAVLNQGEFYSDLQLVIAGKTREGPWEPDLWKRVVTDAKQERSPGRNIATLDWSRGWRIEDPPPAVREPTGGINFTTADRPMITITLNDVEINPVLGYKQVEMICCCESWALYRIRNGRGGLEYAN
jgi:hypothetical protein